MYDGILQDYKAAPQVTTHVTANADDTPTLDLERMYSFPPNAITVSRNLVRAVDEIKPEKTSSGASINEGLQRTRSGSEDGLIAKFEK